MTLVVDDPENTYPTISAIWSEFQAVTRRRGFLLMYAPVFRAHFYHTLQQFYDDGIQYTELRTLLPPVSTISISFLIVHVISINCFRFTSGNY